MLSELPITLLTFSPDTPPPNPPLTLIVDHLDHYSLAVITHSIHPLLADVLESCRPSFRGVGGVFISVSPAG